MTSSDLFQPSWSYNHQNNNLNSILDNVSEDGFCMGSDDTCYTLPTSMEETYLETTMLQERCMNFPVHLDEMDISTEDVLVYFKDPISNIGEITDVSITRSFEESKRGSHSSQQISSMPSSSLMSSDASLDVTSMPSSSLVLPTAGVVFDNELTVFHLIVAYVEAKEMGQKELTEKIAKRIGEKVSPVGDIGERLLYFMLHYIDKQSGYLKQESIKNFYQAFKAFYQIFPYGKFAHFVANLAFLESLPDDADIIHIIDFDIGEGIQWASLIEAIGHQRREVTLTSVKFVDQDDSNDANPLMWRLEEAKKRLLDHAITWLKVEDG